MGTFDPFSERLALLHRYAQEAGRKPSSLDVAFSVGWYDDPQESFLPDGDRRILTGEPSQIPEDISLLEDMGVGYLMLEFEASDLDGRLELIERFASELMPIVQ
ncbi:MAG: hypothetical protein O3A47_03445 [Chloroflexi bacterium]|nr:hypothetical protein [Chloroflexota bacterium]